MAGDRPGTKPAQPPIAAAQAATSGQQKHVWDTIAESFDRTRAKPWRHVVDFVQTIPAGARVLDLMAGNGRHLAAVVEQGCAAFALDWSIALAQSARTKTHGPHGPAHVVGDAVKLPFTDATFDACIYVAGLHGIPDPTARHASLVELRRVLRPGGVAQITVWSRDAPRFAALGLPPGEANLDVPWRADGLDEARSYHLYTQEGLRRAIEDAGLRVEKLEPVAFKWGEAYNLVAVVHRV